jgi:hypothetical protein
VRKRGRRWTHQRAQRAAHNTSETRWGLALGRLYNSNGLLAFFCLLAARFSINVFAGFFFVSFFLSMPLLMYVSSTARASHQAVYCRLAPGPGARESFNRSRPPAIDLAVVPKSYGDPLGRSVRQRTFDPDCVRPSRRLASLPALHSLVRWRGARREGLCFDQKVQCEIRQGI